MYRKFAPLWPGISPGNKSCIELMEEYRKTQDLKVLAQLIKKEDGASRWLTVIAYRILKDVEETEDLIQDLYMRLREKLLEIELPENCRAWLRTVVRNQALNVKKKRDRMKYADEDFFDQRADVVIGPEEKLEAQQMLKKMEKEVEGISRGWEMVLCNVQGHSFTECAQRLGISFNEYRGRYQRANALLKNKYGKHYKKYFFGYFDQE